MKLLTLEEDLNRAIETNRKVSSLQKEINYRKNYIDEWSSMASKEEYMDEYVQDNYKYGFSGCLLSIILIPASFLIAAILISIIYAIFGIDSDNSDKLSYIAIIAFIAYVVSSLVIINLRKRSIRYNAGIAYENKLSNFNEKHALIPEYRKEIKLRQKSIDELCMKCPIRKSLLPLASDLIKYVRQERADTLKEAIKLYIQDDQNANEIEKYTRLLNQKRQEQENVKRMKNEAEQFRIDSEEAEREAAFAEILQIARTMR